MTVSLFNIILFMAIFTGGVGMSQDHLFLDSWRVSNDTKMEGNQAYQIFIISKNNFQRAVIKVNSTGYLEIPKLGKFLVEGKTKSQVEKEVIDKLIKITKQDQIITTTVIIDNVSNNISKGKSIVNKIKEQAPEKIKHDHSLERGIVVMGQVKSPGTYLLNKQSCDILEIIGKAGGLTNSGYPKKIKIYRKGEKVQIVNLVQSLSEISPVLVFPGDSILVPGISLLRKKAAF